MSEKKQIKQMIEDGFSIRHISSSTREEVDVIKHMVNENKWTLKHENFDESKIEYICNLYKTGVSAKQLGKKFSIDKRRIQKWVKERGILRSKSDSHRVTFFDQHYFDVIDTPAKAYWLGFLYADGCNQPNTNTVHITLKADDSSHLEKAALAIEYPPQNIKKYSSKLGDREYPTAALRLHSKYLCSQLIKLGCPPAKSFIVQYPDWLDTSLNHHFIRGLFDGDGCITFRIKQKEWKWSLVSTKESCEEIQKIILDKLGFIVNYHCISKTGNNTYELETSGNEKILSLMSWLYDGSNDSIRLDRKYQKFIELEEQQASRKIRRNKYNLGNKQMSNIIDGVDSGYDSIITINNQKITAKYLRTLTDAEREQLVEPIFQHFRNTGWVYRDPNANIKRSYDKLCAKEFNLEEENVSLFNNSSLATDICKVFCHDFYRSRGSNGRNMIDVWNDDDLLKRVIANRLGLGWKKTPEIFNISFRMILQGMRSMRLVSQITMFKPDIAKYVCMKYSKPGDVVGDYSCGFGGRLLGAMSCGRKYIGTDPLTTPDLEKMSQFFKFGDRCKLIASGSESFRGEKNSVDLYWSSPPYYDYEVYSDDTTQAYNNGEEYFYDEYWAKTLDNVKYMLKPGKWFGLNIKGVPRMLDMASAVFGPYVETVALRTMRSHLNKGAGNEKNEYIYMFVNQK